MKEKVTARNLWRGIYPILFFQGTAIVIQNILMITLSVMSANSKYTGISQYSDRVNKINLHAMEITLLTDIICIIIMAYFMYSDRVKDKLKGIYVKYDKVKWTKYLLVIPFAYFFMMSANALVSILTLYMPENMVGTYDNTKEILNNSSYFMLIITTAIIAPISEEFMHRGVVYNRFKRICPPVLAAIISSTDLFHPLQRRLPCQKEDLASVLNCSLILYLRLLQHMNYISLSQVLKGIVLV